MAAQLLNISVSGHLSSPAPLSLMPYTKPRGLKAKGTGPT